MDRLRERVSAVAGVDAVPAADAGPDDRRRDRARPQYRVSLEGADTRRVIRNGPASWSSGCSNVPRGAQRQSPTPARRASPRYVDIDRDTAARLAITASGDRRRALQRLRPAHRLDHLHRDQPVPRDPRGAARTSRRTPQSLGKLQPAHRRRASRRRCRRSPRSSSGARRCRSRTSAQYPATHASASTPRPASRSARAVDAIRKAAERHRAAAGVTHDLPRRVGRLRGVAGQPAVADPGGGGLRLHRARRAVRELHPSADDPVDAAVGRRRRAAGADASPATTSA